MASHFLRPPETAGRFPVYGSNGIVGFHSQALVKGPGVVVGRKGSSGTVTFSESDFTPIDTAFYVSIKTAPRLEWSSFTTC